MFISLDLELRLKSNRATNKSFRKDPNVKRHIEYARNLTMER